MWGLQRSRLIRANVKLKVYFLSFWKIFRNLQMILFLNSQIDCFSCYCFLDILPLFYLILIFQGH